MDVDSRKNAAKDFIQLIAEGKIKEAYKKHVDMKGKHHNTFTPAGFSALQKGMTDAGAQFPAMKLTVKHVIGDGDIVAVHSHLLLKEGEPGLITVHIFRFSGDKIVEMWDMSQQVPSDPLNIDGAF